MDFPRSKSKPRQLLLTPLIDVVFLLLVYFMISTSFVQNESMELSLPGSGEKTASPADVLNVFVGNDGTLYLGRNAIPEVDLTDILQKEFSKDTTRRVLLRSADAVTVQKLVSVLDLIYLAGGRNIAVADWEQPYQPQQPQPQPMSEFPTQPVPPL